MKYFLYVFAFIGLLSCASIEEYKGGLPKASGALEELLIIQDSLGWSGELGENLRGVVKKAHPGVIDPEAFFKTAYLPLEHFGGIFTKHHFIFIPITVDQVEGSALLKTLISDKAIAKAKEEKTNLYKKHDVFAKGQTIVFLLASESYYLNQFYNKQSLFLREVLAEELQKQYADQLKELPVNSNLQTRLINQQGYDIHLPSGYELAKEEANFCWFRNVLPEADMNVFVYKVPYEDTLQFDDAKILMLRDAVGQKHIFSDDSQSFMQTEMLSPPLVRVEQTKEGVFKKFHLGLWKINKKAMGGSYVSILLKSPINNTLYYAEGFVYAPGQEKLNYIRKLEAIIRTLEPIQHE